MRARERRDIPAALPWLVLTFAVPATALVVAPGPGVPFANFLPFKLTALALAAAAAGACVVRAPRVGLARHEVLAAAFTVAAALSWALNARARAFSAMPLVFGTAALLVAFGTRIAVACRPDVRRRALDVILCTALVVAALAILESAGLRLPWSGLRRPEGTLGNRNFVAAYVAIALPLAAGAAQAKLRTWRTGVIAPFVVVLVLTRCRSAWIGGAAALLLVLAARVFDRRAGSRGKRLRGACAVLALCAVGVAAASAVSWPGLQWSEPAPLAATLHRIAEYDAGSGKARLEQHEMAIAILRRSPVLGVGPHGWADAASANAHVVAGEHASRWLGNLTPSSDLVRIATETGGVGLVLAAGALLLLVSGLIRHAVARAADAGYGASIGAALTALAIHGLFDAPLYRPETLGLAAVLVGLVPQMDPPSLRPWPRWMTRGATVLVAGAATALAVLMLASTALQRGGATHAIAAAQRWYARPAEQEELVRRYAAHRRCDDALAALGDAMRWTPHVWGPLVAAEPCARGAERSALHARAAAVEPHVDALLGIWSKDPPLEDAWLVNAYRQPYPVAVAPSGDRVALERRTDDVFELSVAPLTVEGVTRTIDRSHMPQLAPSFSPDGRRIAFLRDDGSGFALHVVDSATGEAMPLDAPWTETAITPIVWAPDGSRLAYVQTRAGDSLLVGVDLASTPASARTLTKASLESATSWTPAGLPVVPLKDASQAIVAVERWSDGSFERTYRSPFDGVAGDVSVSPDGSRVAVTARPAGRDYFALYEIDARTGTWRVCLDVDRDLQRPSWLSGARIAVRGPGSSDAYTFVGTCDHFDRLGAPGEDTTVLGENTRTEALVALVRSPSVPDRVESFQREERSTLFSAPGELLLEGCIGSCPELASVASADGLQVPLRVWRADHAPPSGRAAVVYVHGGPHLRTASAWDASTAWLVRSGIDVISVDYRGSGGHGARFEQAGDLGARAADVAAAVNYASGALGVARERCVVLGESYGAYLVARASADGLIGHAPIALVSLLRVQRAMPAVGKPAAVLAFHGAADAVAPAGVARRFLEETFGADALSSPRGTWALLPDEGHGLHRPRSRIAIVEAVASLLEPSREPGYPGAERVATNCDGKCNESRLGTPVDTIVVHSTEYEDWATSLQRLTQAPGRSAHYLVGRDGRIAQLLPETDVAWHAGNREMNLRSIGIEHVGLASEPFTEPQYAASVRLVRYLMDKYGIPLDRAHVIGHDQVPDGNAMPADAPPCLLPSALCEADDRYGGASHHRDPGPFWTWSAYMARLAD